MLNQQLYLVKHLHQSRAAELQQRALEQRLLKETQQNSAGLLSRLFVFSASLIAMFF